MRALMGRAAFSQTESTPSPPPPPPPPPNQPNRISPAVLFIIVILAVIFFISGLLHLLIRLLIKKQPNSDPDRAAAAEAAGPGTTVQRQLQQLFHLHDSGLDQTIIDSLPVFLYEEILGPKEPFDCAVCLCEFFKEDKLRLLPGCGHAFHIDCIDTWLLSNSTCPLCRGSLGVMVENTEFLFDNTIEQDGCRDDRDAGKLEEEKVVFSIRLGKFRNVSKTENADSAAGEIGNVSNAGKEIGDTSSSNLDARRCLSMGSYQYVLANSSLQVACTSSVKGRSMRFASNGTRHEVPDERKISASTRGESLSVSRIWQRSDQRGGNIRGNSSSQGKSILVRLPVMEEKGGDPDP